MIEEIKRIKTEILYAQLEGICLNIFLRCHAVSGANADAYIMHNIVW